MIKVICRQSLNHIAINNDVDNILFDSWPLPRKLSSPIFQFYVYVGPTFYVKHLHRVLKTIFTEMQTCTEV